MNSACVWRDLSMWRVIACATILSLQVGCSEHPRAYPASGVVVFEDGAPLSQGRIELRSLEHPYSARGAVNSEGAFTLTTYATGDGAIAGKHQVLIVQRFGVDVDNIEEHRKHASMIRKLDTKYSSYATSGLEVNIDPKGDNGTLRLVVD